MQDNSEGVQFDHEFGTMRMRDDMAIDFRRETNDTSKQDSSAPSFHFSHIRALSVLSLLSSLNLSLAAPDDTSRFIDI